MSRAAIVLPNQLFRLNPAVEACAEVWLVEEKLYFEAHPFLQQKLIYTRTCMKEYEAALLSQNRAVHYISSTEDAADIRGLIPHLKARGVDEVHLCNPVDDWLERRLGKACGVHGVALVFHPSPGFILSHEEALEYRPRSKRYYQLDFYIAERRRRNVLLNRDGSPVGGHWSFDAENRRPLPRSVVPPRLVADGEEDSATLAEAKEHISRVYPNSPGNTEMQWEGGVSTYFPTTSAGATAWLDKFFEARFADFGPYQDAIIPTENLLFHSAISPMLNIGLLEPANVLSQTMERGRATGVPMSSIEGFVRQILGWREYVRMTYAQAGRRMRTSNHFEFPKRPLPQAFWDGTTGIPPVDNVIRKVLRIGWCHHIERLMVIGNFMLLCEVHPDEVYRWFSALFHDAYDWVMVPNVYGMSQFADGGLLATKPYISGSAYLMKMGRYERGLWQGVWDALYWRFLLVHEETLRDIRRVEAMPDAKVVLDPARRKLVMDLADDFLEKLWG